MITVKRIVFPTDFSLAAAHALEHAISVALEHRAKMYLVHVIEDIGFVAPFTLTPTSVIEEYHHGIIELAEQNLRKLISPQVRQQIEVEEVVAEGKAFVEILRIAKGKKADLIVMATHGRTGRIHTLLGSTSERVIGRATCPVLAVPYPDTEIVAHQELLSQASN